MENEDNKKPYNNTDYSIDTKGNVYGKYGKKLKPQLTKKGYYGVNLYIDGKMYHKSIHRLVCETFLDNPDNKDFVNHIDGNKLNNCISNLEWVTPSENLTHAYTLGFLTQKGEKNNASKLDEFKVKQIRNLFDKKIKKHSTVLASEFGVTRRTIEKIVKKQLWNHI